MIDALNSAVQSNPHRFDAIFKEEFSKITAEEDPMENFSIRPDTEGAIEMPSRPLGQEDEKMPDRDKDEQNKSNKETDKTNGKSKSDHLVDVYA